MRMISGRLHRTVMKFSLNWQFLHSSGTHSKPKCSKHISNPRAISEADANKNCTKMTSIFHRIKSNAKNACTRILPIHGSNFEECTIFHAQPINVIRTFFTFIYCYGLKQDNSNHRSINKYHFAINISKQIFAEPGIHIAQSSSACFKRKTRAKPHCIAHFMPPIGIGINWKFMISNWKCAFDEFTLWLSRLPLSKLLHKL